MSKIRLIMISIILILSLLVVGLALASDNSSQAYYQSGNIEDITTAEGDPGPDKNAPIENPLSDSGVTSVSTDYEWSQLTGEYVEIVGGTVHGTPSNDDTSFSSIPLGFTFTYNHVPYTDVSIQSNGFVAMGPIVSSSYTPLSSGISNNVLAILGRDIQGDGTTSELMSLMEGTEPNRVFTVQWKHYKRYGTAYVGDDFNFQIKLFESSNLVEYIYGPFTVVYNAAPPTVQVGIRGDSNQDFLNRMTGASGWTDTLPGTSNTDVMELTDVIYPPSGLTWDWTPPPPGPYYAESSMNAPSIVEFGDPINYTITISNTGTLPGLDTWMTDTIPVGTTYNGDVSCTSGSCWFENGIVYWNGQVIGPPMTERDLAYRLEGTVVGEEPENPVIVTFSVTPDNPVCGLTIANEAVISDPDAFAPVTVSAVTDVWEMIEINESFDGETFPPIGWTEIHTDTGTTWTNLDLEPRGNLTGGTGVFAIIDDDYAGLDAITQAELWTPPFDIPGGGYETHLLFKTDYNNLSVNESANVDISVDDGASWINLLHWNTDHRGPLTQSVDLTDYADTTGAILRFYYDDGGAYAWWWEIDDVQIVSCYVTYPDINVDPLQLDSILLPDQQETQPLTICNSGDANLTWELSEVLPGTANSSPTAPTDMGYAQDIGYISDNFVSFELDDFSGQAVVGTTTNVYYGMDFDPSATTLYALNDTTGELGTIDLTTTAFTGLVPCPAPVDIWTGLSIDPNTGVFYASDATNLYTIDPATGAATLVGPFGTGLMIEIAMGPEGDMYGHDIGTDAIYQIDPNTGAATLVGPTGYNANYAQGMDFDNQDGTLYIWLYQGSGANIYGTVNLTTGAVTPLAVSAPLGEFEGATKTTAGPPPDLPWLSEDPTSGEVLPGECSDVNVTFDSTGLTADTYTGGLDIFSNDPDEPTVSIPVTLTVINLRHIYLPFTAK